MKKIKKWMDILDKSIENKEIETSLPKFLYHDIETLCDGLDKKVTYLDCLYSELEASINSAEVDRQISSFDANHLRNKYL